jgi:MFS family permease
VAAGTEYLQGVYQATWSLHLLNRQAEIWQIGLSFSLIALPSVLLSVWFGGLIDRRGARRVMLVVFLQRRRRVRRIAGGGAIPRAQAPLLVGWRVLDLDPSLG